MFNLCVRASRSCFRQPASALKLLRPYASFTVRDILYETSDEAGTLLTRFAKHIATESQMSGPDGPPTTIRYSDYFPISELHYFRKQLRTTAGDQLPALIVFASTYRANAEPAKFAQILNDLDEAAVKCLGSMDNHLILKTLYAFMFLLPNWMTRLDFYRSALHKLVGDFQLDQSKDNFTQVCFYLGLDKKSFKGDGVSRMLESMLENHLEEYLSTMSPMDLAIVSNAAFKTATMVHSKLYAERLTKEILAITTESQGYDALLVNFIKTARFQRLHSSELCEHLTGLCRQSHFLRHLQPQGLVHIFAYFAENSWDDQEVTRLIIDEFLQRLDTEQKKFQSIASIRVKDLSMFLWCCAHLNCTLSARHLEEIDAVLQEKLQNDEYRYFPDQLVDACLSLWTLGHKSKFLLKQAINAKEDSAQYNQRKQKRPAQPKVDSRLTVLLASAAIEEPQWLGATLGQKNNPFNLDATVPDYLLRQRQDLVEYSKNVAGEEEVSVAKIVCPINGINIPGILVEFRDEQDGKAFVELLSNEQILRFSGEPVGLMQLKIRLLESMGYNVAVLGPNDLTEKYSSLRNWLFEADALDSPKEQNAHQNS